MPLLAVAASCSPGAAGCCLGLFALDIFCAFVDPLPSSLAVVRGERKMITLADQFFRSSFILHKAFLLTKEQFACHERFMTSVIRAKDRVAPILITVSRISTDTRVRNLFKEQICAFYNKFAKKKKSIELKKKKSYSAKTDSLFGLNTFLTCCHEQWMVISGLCSITRSWFPDLCLSTTNKAFLICEMFIDRSQTAVKKHWQKTEISKWLQLIFVLWTDMKVKRLTKIRKCCNWVKPFFHPKS